MWENGKLIERSEVKVSNASHTAVSKNKRFLYSIEDEGVAVFARDENGDLTRINSVDIDGMRGCFLATDVDGKYLYVAGYHDGKVTVGPHSQRRTSGKPYGRRIPQRPRKRCGAQFPSSCKLCPPHGRIINISAR